jgi:hypothetical protein
MDSRSDVYGRDVGLMKPKPYKCLFVDWHLTLSTSVFWEQFSDPAHPQHRLLAFMQAALFTPMGVETWVIPWMRGVFTSEEVMVGVCRGTDFDPDFALQALQSSCQQMRLVSEAIPRCIRDLQAKGLRVVIATDNMDTFHRWTVPGLRLPALFDDILSSWQLRALKEDRRQDGQSLFFADYLQAHQIGWGESLLLDDGDEAFGNTIRQFGIDFQHIEPGKGLVPALQGIVASFV